MKETTKRQGRLKSVSLNASRTRAEKGTKEIHNIQTSKAHPHKKKARKEGVKKTVGRTCPCPIHLMVAGAFTRKGT